MRDVYRVRRSLDVDIEHKLIMMSDNVESIRIVCEIVMLSCRLKAHRCHVLIQFTIYIQLVDLMILLVVCDHRLKMFVNHFFEQSMYLSKFD